MLVSVGALQVDTEGTQRKQPDFCAQFDMVNAAHVDIQTLLTSNAKRCANIAFASCDSLCEFQDQIESSHAVKNMHASVESGKRHVARPL